MLAATTTTRPDTWAAARAVTPMAVATIYGAVAAGAIELIHPFIPTLFNLLYISRFYKNI
jgi:hypothetical protein